MSDINSVGSIPNDMLYGASANKNSTVKPADFQPSKEIPDHINEEEKIEAINEALDLQDEVSRVNEYAQNIQRNLEFSIDEESKKTVVKVLDMSTGELIRQIPEEHFLDVARRIRNEGDLTLIDDFI